MAFPVLMYFPNIVPSPNTFQKLAKNANLKPSTWNSISTRLDIIYLMLPASQEYLHSAKLLFFSTHLRGGTNRRHGMVLKTWFEHISSSRQNLRTPLLIDFLPLPRIV